MKRSINTSGRFRLARVAAAAALAVLMITPTAAIADEPGEDLTQADDLHAVVADAAPDAGLEAVTFEDEAGLLVGVSEAAVVEVPTDADAEISIESDELGRTLTIGLPVEVEAEDAQLSPDGEIALYPAQSADDAAMTVETFEDGSVRIQTVLASSESPREFTYELSVPAGGRIVVEADGSASVLDAEGLWVAGAGSPWAFDAAGNEVATRYEARGDSLVQIVSPGEGVQYPITADPVLGIWLISKVVKDTSPSQGTTYRVTPTLNGRAASSIYYGVLWSDAKAKGLPNVSKYKDQLLCHPMSQLAIFKSTWNIDSWRPDVGLAKTIAAACNPT